MRSRATVLLLMGLMLLAGHAFAQCKERLMIPVIAHAVPGNYGSIWETRLAITNHSAEPVYVSGHGICFLNPCLPPEPIREMSTIFPGRYRQFLGVECDRVQDLTVQLRVQDLSRQSETWGTSIPVVGEDELFDRRVMSIVDVPNTAEFRSMLRVYGFDGQQSTVSIRIYELDERISERGRPDELLVALTRTLPAESAPHAFPSRMDLPLWTIPELENSARIRLEIEGDQGHRLWSFVSASNNATQHVTVLTPR
jgi:hypothetical protein